VVMNNSQLALYY